MSISLLRLLRLLLLRQLLPPQRRRGGQPGCEHLGAVRRDDQRVLKLRRPLAILRGCRPAVGPRHVAVRALVDHGLCAGKAGQHTMELNEQAQ